MLAEAAMQTLLDYDWPGNVRQLENTIERAAVLAQGGLIGPSHLVPSESTGAQEQLLTDALERLLDQGRGLDALLGDLRQRLIAIALGRNGGDRAAAARLLGVEEDALG